MSSVGVVGLGAMGGEIAGRLLDAELILDPPERAWFDIDLMHKDIRLALQAAHGLDVPLPSAQAASEILGTARKLGYGHRDIASLREVLGRLSEIAAVAKERPAGEPALAGTGGTRA
jgi:3-hydroxyisobutyrate dehydrogenase-like beta-hydroxyacid dehydrogenase